ncbi:MAG: M67 family metallopeptidase [Candidatus Omnitrophica bacterium]|nr:M67 family metallopeptidase [Candidatus Omnitrophota bacterium]
MVRISQRLYREIIAHCQSRYPKEACGLLAGAAAPRAGQAGARPGSCRAGDVVQVYPMTNVEDSPIGYAMDPKEQLQNERQMRSRNQRLVGIYHSHTASPAYPSSVDVGLAISPEVSYVLVSLQDRAHPALKSFRIDGQQITAEEAIIEDGPCGHT